MLISFQWFTALVLLIFCSSSKAIIPKLQNPYDEYVSQETLPAVFVFKENFFSPVKMKITDRNGIKEVFDFSKGLLESTSAIKSPDSHLSVKQIKKASHSEVYDIFKNYGYFPTDIYLISHTLYNKSLPHNRLYSYVSFLMDERGNVVIHNSTQLTTMSLKTDGSLIFEGNNNLKKLKTKSKSFVNEGLFKAVHGKHAHSTYINNGVMHFTSIDTIASVNDYQQIYKDYLINLNRTSVQEALKNSQHTFINNGVFLADNGIRFNHIKQVNYGLSMLKNAHINEGSIENHKDYILQGTFTGYHVKIHNEGWIDFDQLNSLITPHIDQNKLILSKWMNRGDVYLGSDSSVMALDEFDNGIWQNDNVIFSLGSLTAGSYKNTISFGALGSNSHLKTLTEMMTVEEANKRFTKTSAYYTPEESIEVLCCEPINKIGLQYKASPVQSLAKISKKELNKGPTPKQIAEYKSKHQAILNLYNTLNASLTNLGINQTSNNNLFMDYAPQVDRQDKGFQTHKGKISIFHTPIAPKIDWREGYKTLPSNLNTGLKEGIDQAPDRGEYNTDIVDKILETFGEVYTLQDHFEYINHDQLKHFESFIPFDPSEISTTRESAEHTRGLRLFWQDHNKNLVHGIRINDAKPGAWPAQRQNYMTITFNGNKLDQDGNLVVKDPKQDIIYIRDRLTREILETIFTKKSPKEMPHVHIPFQPEYYLDFFKLVESSPVKNPLIKASLKRAGG